MFPKQPEEVNNDPEPESFLPPRKSVAGDSLLPIAGLVVVACLAPMITVKFNFSAFHFGQDSKPSLVPLQLWLFMISVQAFAWAIILSWALPQLRAMTRIVSPTQKTDWLRAGSITAILGVILAIGSSTEMNAHLPPASVAKISILHYFGPTGIAVACVIVVGLIVAYLRTLRNVNGQPVALKAIETLARDTALVQQFFMAAAAVLALGVVGTAALRNAVEADSPRTFPAEYVIFNGLSETLILLAVYARIRLKLYFVSSQLIEIALGPEPATLDELVSRNKNRIALEALLGQDTSSIFGLGGALPLLLPFLISLVTKLLTH